MIDNPTIEEFKKQIEALEKEVKDLAADRRSSDLMRNAVESTISAIGITDLQGKLIYVNNAGVKLWGYDDKSELIGRALTEFWEGNGIYETIKQLQEKGVASGEDIGKRKDGSLFNAQFEAAVINSDDGNPAYMFGSFLNITDRKIAEKKVLASEKLFKNLFEHTVDYALVLKLKEGSNPIIIDLTESACEKHGYTRDEIVGKPISILDTYSHPEHVIIAEKVLAGESVIFETTHRRKDGSTFPVEVASKLIEINGEQLAFSIERDISDRKESELERHKLEAKTLAYAKLASLGEIATGIAHEMNQPLSYIRVIYESTLADLESGILNQEELKEEFSEALRQVSRISKIIDHLRTFGHAGPKEFDNVNLGSVLDNTLILMSERLRLQDITLNSHIEENLKDIRGNAGQLEQIFINLFQNSMDVLESRKDGIINLSIRNQNNGVLIHFSDNGKGVPQRLLNKIFEPFFTTKEVGKGTGLGLSIVFGIVEDHDGTISCESSPNEGATFFISFPLSKHQ